MKNPPPTPSKFCAGCINSSGVVTNPIGNFSARKVSTGYYIVQFPTDFHWISGLVTPFNFVCALLNSSAPPNDHAMAITTAVPSSGANADAGFYFQAWGY
jgi:hypothetical protein